MKLIEKILKRFGYVKQQFETKIVYETHSLNPIILKKEMTLSNHLHEFGPLLAQKELEKDIIEELLKQGYVETEFSKESSSTRITTRLIVCKQKLN